MPAAGPCCWLYMCRSLRQWWSDSLPPASSQSRWVHTSWCWRSQSPLAQESSTVWWGAGYKIRMCLLKATRSPRLAKTELWSLSWLDSESEFIVSSFMFICNVMTNLPENMHCKTAVCPKKALVFSEYTGRGSIRLCDESVKVRTNYISISSHASHWCHAVVNWTWLLMLRVVILSFIE